MAHAVFPLNRIGADDLLEVRQFAGASAKVHGAVVDDGNTAES